MAEIIDYGSFDPLRPPDWRHQRVLSMVDRPGAPGRSTVRDDKYVRALRQFVLRYRAAGDEGKRWSLRNENPGLFYAYDLYFRRENEPEFPLMIEARLLAEQTDAQIAAACSTIPQTVRWYELLFFNVRKKLACQDWIMKHVLVPSFMQGAEPGEWVDNDGVVRQRVQKFANQFFDATLKYFAYMGGPAIVDYLILAGRRDSAPRSADDFVQWMESQRDHALHYRTIKAAATFEVNRYNVIELFATSTRLTEIAKSSVSEEAKRTSMESNIESMLSVMPWAVGRDARKHLQGTAAAKYDNTAAELRDEELLLLTSGQELDTIKDVTELQIDQAMRGKDADDGNPKQTSGAKAPGQPENRG